jgi:apolipoprotein N-acyltransferase
MLGAAALPPVHALPALLIAFPGLLWLIAGAYHTRRAFADGWWFGLGHFVAGFYWLAYPLLVDAASYAWLIPFAVLALPAAFALYIGVVVAAVHRVPTMAGRVIALAILWTAFEWLRGQLFTGFPWNAIGTAWVFSDAALQGAAIGGVFGLSVLTVFCAAAPAVLGAKPRRGAMILPITAIAVVVTLFAAGSARLPVDPIGTVADIRLRIVQPNITQKLKWVPALKDRHLANYLELSSQKASQPPTHIIWPETAVPFILSRDERRRRAMASIVPPGGALLTGALRVSKPGETPFRLWNSLVALDGAARITNSYDKFHLVPFGEYMPFGEVLGLNKLTAGRTDFSAGPGPRTLRIAGLPPVSPLICYEIIFPGKIVSEADRPRWLLNVTNDAWFGTSSAPYQHLAMARLRAVEQGLPVVRAANTGISAVIDPYGRVVERLGLNQRGIIDSDLPLSLGTRTVYGQYGDLILIIVFMVLLIPLKLIS